MPCMAWHVLYYGIDCSVAHKFPAPHVRTQNGFGGEGVASLFPPRRAYSFFREEATCIPHYMCWLGGARTTRNYTSRSTANTYLCIARGSYIWLHCLFVTQRCRKLSGQHKQAMRLRERTSRIRLSVDTWWWEPLLRSTVYGRRKTQWRYNGGWRRYKSGLF